jgi:hypothetical protein
MIHYALVCDAGHAFEGWFRSSEDFEGQAGRHLIGCPTCASTGVTRAPMAPNVRSGRGREAKDETPPAVPARRPVMVADETQKAMLEAMREIRRKVTENATWVGDRFADEARRMHYGEIEHTGIYGEATAEEVTALADEGVEFQPLPILPEDRN